MLLPHHAAGGSGRKLFAAAQILAHDLLFCCHLAEGFPLRDTKKGFQAVKHRLGIRAEAPSEQGDVCHFRCILSVSSGQRSSSVERKLDADPRTGVSHFAATPHQKDVGTGSLPALGGLAPVGEGNHQKSSTLSPFAQTFLWLITIPSQMHTAPGAWQGGCHAPSNQEWPEGPSGRACQVFGVSAPVR